MPDLEEGIPDTRLGRAVIKIRTELAKPSVIHRVGELWLRNHDSQSRIVWVVRPSRITRPERTTGGAFTSGAQAQRSTPSRTRHEQVQAYLYAADQGAVEALLDAVLVALDKAFGSEAEPSSYEWETQQRPGSTVDEGGAGYMNAGERMRLDVGFRWLVLSEISPLFIATSLEHGC
jgi:hypothetical protein